MTNIVTFDETNVGRCLLDFEKSATALAQLLSQFSLVKNSDQVHPSTSSSTEASNELRELASTCVSVIHVLRDEIIRSQKSQEALFSHAIDSLVARIEVLRKDQNQGVDELLSDVNFSASHL